MTNASAFARWPLSGLEGAVLQPLWLDPSDRPTARPPVNEEVEVDLRVVGGRFSGLWTALRAAETESGTRVLLGAADRLTEDMPSRDSGFFEAVPTHGELNALVAGASQPGAPAAAAPSPHAGGAGPGATAEGEAPSSTTEGGLDLLSLLGATVARQAVAVLAGMALGFVLGRVGRRCRSRREATGTTGPWAVARLNAWLETRLYARGLR